MSEIGELNQQTYGRSWGDVLRDAVATVDEQPETESEAEAIEEPEQETVETSEEVAESVDDQPETESEPEAPTFNDDTEIEMGENRKAVKLSELREGYLRQSDYTKKTQELATQRKELDAQTEKLKPVQSWLDYMDNNPWVFSQIDQALKDYHNTGVIDIQEALQDAQFGKYINHYMAENKRLQDRLNAIEGEYEGVKLSADMTRLSNELKSDYGDLVTDDYMQSLQERAKNEKLSSATLKEIADGHLAKQKLKSQPSAKATEAKAIQKLAETRTKAPAAPKQTAQTPAAPQKANDGSWKSFFSNLMNQ